MASTKEFAEYVCEQISGAGEIVSRKMFGEYGIYCNGKFIGLVCDNQFYLKPTEAGKTLAPDIPQGPPYKGAKDSFIVEFLEDTERLIPLVQATEQALPPPKEKKPKAKKKTMGDT